jgi:hypothetical protein
MMNNDNQFYIGWMPKAPGLYVKIIRKTILSLTLLTVTTAIVLALQQKKFSTASFEYGQLTTVKGIYQVFPVPSIRINTPPDPFGHSSSITIPLVGYGKFGAEGVIESLEKENNRHLDQMQVTLKGTLLYSDGKTLLQIDENDKPLLQISNPPAIMPSHVIKELGMVKLQGEILDPKCYFGVMKPGHGKPHRDCAARCIEGGMSPVFRIGNKKQEMNYYLLLDSAGKKMNKQLINYIGEPVSLEAKAVQYDDWVILYLNGTGNIKRVSRLSWIKSADEIISCGPTSN